MFALFVVGISPIMKEMSIRINPVKKCIKRITFWMTDLHNKNKTKRKSKFISNFETRRKKKLSISSLKKLKITCATEWSEKKKVRQYVDAATANPYSRNIAVVGNRQSPPMN